jgi:hypothetical protein
LGEVLVGQDQTESESTDFGEHVVDDDESGELQLGVLHVVSLRTGERLAWAIRSHDPQPAQGRA